jgi:hypothetical protein
MQKNILWRGIANQSLENCILTSTKNYIEINSVIIGLHEQVIYKVEYFIKTNKDWEATFFEIKSTLAGENQSFGFESDGKGNWITNGKPAEQFNGCIDIDISLTPFTNTLPINRLNLSENERQKINILYIDILNRQIKPVQQHYTRLSKYKYKYENVPNDFEAIITVDEFGLIVNYPELFERIGMR